MKRIMLFALAVGVPWTVNVCAGGAWAQQQGIPLETRNFMQAKLRHSQKILEGLATENFDMIGKHAQEMSLLSLESHWNVLRTQRYIDESADFRHAIERLREAANAKKIDAAALGYVDVTLKCIHCHTYVRDKGTKEAIGLQIPPTQPPPANQTGAISGR